MSLPTDEETMLIALTDNDLDIIVRSLSYRMKRLTKHIRMKEAQGLNPEEARGAESEIADLWYNLNAIRKSRR